MTASKIERLRQELIEKYGDIVLIKAFSKATRKLVGEGKLSIIKIKNTADYKEILRIIKEGRPREIMVA